MTLVEGKNLLGPGLFRDELIVRLGKLWVPTRERGSFEEDVVEVVAHPRLVEFPLDIVWSFRRPTVRSSGTLNVRERVVSSLSGQMM